MNGTLRGNWHAAHYARGEMGGESNRGKAADERDRKADERDAAADERDRRLTCSTATPMKSTGATYPRYFKSTGSSANIASVDRALAGRDFQLGAQPFARRPELLTTG